MSRSFMMLILVLGGCGEMRAKPGDPQKPLVCTVCPSGYHCEAGVCVGGDSSAIDLDASTVTLSGTLVFDGVAPTGACTTTDTVAHLRFIGDDGADFDTDVPCAASGGAFSLRLQRGTYRVIAYRNSNIASLPAGRFVVHHGLEVKDDVSDLVFDANTVPVGGTLSFEGVAPKGSCSTTDTVAHLRFVGDDGADFDTDVPCASTSGAWALRVQPGSYRVIAYRNSNLASLPDGRFVVDRAFSVSAARSGVAFDARTVTASGKLSFNGLAPKGACTTSDTVAHLNFISEDGADFDTDVPCGAPGGEFSVRVQPGTYHVIAYRNSNLASLPDGRFLVDRALTVSGTKSGLAYDARTVRVDGKLTFDGLAPGASGSACSAGDYVARLDFVGENGASFDAEVPCPSAGGSFTAQVAPGTYRVLARRNSSFATLPDGEFLVERNLVVTSAVSGLTWDAATVPVSGRVLFDGVALRASATGSCSSDYLARVTFAGEQMRLPGVLGDLGFTQGTSFDTEVPCPTVDGAYSIRVAPGTYRITVSANSSVKTLPVGKFTIVNALAIN
jgi:hypothetical protein